MGTMKFQLPPNLGPDDCAELRRSYLIGGPDCMPFQTDARCEDGQLSLMRSIEDSGSIQVPWMFADIGRLIACSGTLIERPKPYHLLVELARGKINQVRNQAADWQLGGLEMSDELAAHVREAHKKFCRVMAANPDEPDISIAEEALNQGFIAADQLVQAYIHQVFAYRHQDGKKLPTKLGCCIPTSGAASTPSEDFAKSFHRVDVRFSWKSIQPQSGTFEWDEPDAIVAWAEKNNLQIVGGPLIDFCGNEWPTWLWEEDRDYDGFTALLQEYIEQAVHHFAGHIKRWNLATGLNNSPLMPRKDEELFLLMVRLIEAARKVQPDAEMELTISQPWGEYVHDGDRTYAAFVYADTLVRANANIQLSALNLEIVHGVSAPGSYCRDLIEVSRILDLYAVFGLPLHVTLAYPSADGHDPLANPDSKIDAGKWRDGFTPQVQADWISCFGSLALCKPYVQAVKWMQWSDAAEHAFPHCGLIDAAGIAKPGLDRFRVLREEHL